MSVKEAMEASGMGRTELFKLMKSGKVEYAKKKTPRGTSKRLVYWQGDKGLKAWIDKNKQKI